MKGQRVSVSIEDRLCLRNLSQVAGHSQPVAAAASKGAVAARPA